MGIFRVNPLPDTYYVRPGPHVCKGGPPDESPSDTRRCDRLPTGPSLARARLPAEEVRWELVSEYKGFPHLSWSFVMGVSYHRKGSLPFVKVVFRLRPCSVKERHVPFPRRLYFNESVFSVY